MKTLEFFRHGNFLYSLLFVFLSIFGIEPSVAQRVFVVSELGKVQEVKSGEVENKWMGLKTTQLKKSRPAIVTAPLKVYVLLDGAFDKTEWYVHVMRKNSQYDVLFSNTGYDKGLVKNKIKATPISENIVELELDKWYLNPPSPKDMPVIPNLAITYSPSKKSKKEGKSEKFWFVKISDQEYDEDEISWTPSQIEYSINEIVATKSTTKQLFASLVPDQSSNLIASNGGIQYVLVKEDSPNTINPKEGMNNQEPSSVKDCDVDIDIPYNNIKQENAFALVISNENYSKVASVPFALRDGQMMNDYLIRTLGYDKEHVSFVKNATMNDMKYELNRLSKISKAYNGDMTLLVYYCGHGIPDEKNGNGYLLPVDGYGNDVSTALSTEELYSFLSELNVKRTILFMDACFSGASKDGNMLVSARGIAIKSQEAKPSGNLIAFSACQGDETAYPYHEKGHGLMTYYLLKKIQETKGNVNLAELESYISDNVSKTSIVNNGKPQTPSISISPEMESSWQTSPLIY